MGGRPTVAWRSAKSQSNLFVIGQIFPESWSPQEGLEVCRRGGVREKREKRTPGNLCGEFWLEIRNSFLRMAFYAGSFWYLLPKDSGILNVVMDSFRNLTFIHSWNETSVLWKERMV